MCAVQRCTQRTFGANVQYGRPRSNRPNRGRRSVTQQGQGPSDCFVMMISTGCRGAQAQKNQYPGLRGNRG